MESPLIAPRVLSRPAIRAQEGDRGFGPSGATQTDRQAWDTGRLLLRRRLPMSWCYSLSGSLIESFGGSSSCRQRSTWVQLGPRCRLRANWSLCCVPNCTGLRPAT